MVFFIDGHDFGKNSEEDLEASLNSSRDQFGVSTLSIYHNVKQNQVYCVCDGPDEVAIRKHHKVFDLECDFVMQISKHMPLGTLREEKLKIMGELASSVAHDFRIPLSVITTALDVIKMQNKDLDQKTLQHFKMIQDSVSKMKTRIDGILDFTKTTPIVFSEESLSKIIQSTLEKITMPENVDVNFKPNKITTKCDPSQLETVLLNLILNSIEAIGKNKGSISIRIKEVEGKCIIEIEDTGSGIPNEDLSRIFDPLYTTKSTGIGLGLLSCKNIVEQHRGTINVKNNPTTFCVSIPKH